jgi:dTDP-4-amino-4,6-dideoxygalactose transaminase
MSEVEAAIGLEQLRRLPAFLAARQDNFEALHRGLRDIDEIEFFASSSGRFSSSYYCMSLLLKPALQPSRLEIVRRLSERGIGVSVYYPRPVPHMTYYQRQYGEAALAFPNARRISDASIALPIGPHVSREDVQFIVDAVKDAVHAAVRS